MALSKTGRRILRLSVMLFFLMAAKVQPSEKINPFVSFSKGRLTIRAVEVSLRELAKEIGKRSGIVIELRDQEAAEEPLTLNLIELSPGLAFEEILRGFSFAFFYEKGRLAHVVVLSSEAPPQELSLSRSSPERAPSDSKPSRSDPRLDLERLLVRNRDEGMKAIAQALKGSDSMTKLRAIEALGSVEDPAALQLLSEALGDSDLEVKKSALETLAEKEGPDVVPVLSRALRDPDPSFRIEVLEALAEKGELQLVRSALADQNNEVRERAAELLEIEGRGE